MIDDMRDYLCKELFCFVVVAVISFLWYYLHELSPDNFAIYIYRERERESERERHWEALGN